LPFKSAGASKLFQCDGTIAGASLEFAEMSASELQVAYQADDDGTGQIIAVVKSGEFSARGAAWFNPDVVKRTFVAAFH
jgi:hypothetical protein